MELSCDPKFLTDLGLATFVLSVVSLFVIINNIVKFERADEIEDENRLIMVISLMLILNLMIFVALLIVMLLLVVQTFMLTFH